MRMLYYVGLIVGSFPVCRAFAKRTYLKKLWPRISGTPRHYYFCNASVLRNKKQSNYLTSHVRRVELLSSFELQAAAGELQLEAN